MELIARLQLVLSTLEGMTVTGRDNMERVVASCQEIERIINVLENPAHPVADVKEETDG